VRGMNCRGLRLELVAGLGIALAMPALAVAAQSAQGLNTQTRLSSEIRDQGGRTQATLAIAVTGEDGLPASGAVSIEDSGRTLAGAALDAQGQTNLVLDLPGGDHLLRAVYGGDATHRVSTSSLASIHAQASATPDFQVTLSPVAPTTLPMTLTPGNAGTILITLTPENNALLPGPMFITLSCSGLPDQAACTANPTNLQILPTSNVPPTSFMVIQTQARSGATSASTAGAGRNPSPIAWALLLPGALFLGGLAFGRRGGHWLTRLSMLALIGLGVTLGATGCNPRYGYKNHGPDPSPGTPAGTYTVTVNAQSSNGVTATNRYATFVLTVK